MAETQTVIRIETQLWRTFKGECIKRATSPTKVLETYIAQQVRAWEHAAQEGKR